MKFLNSKKKVILSAVAVLLISVSAFAGSTNQMGSDEETIFGKMFGTSCTVTGYQETCCKHTFWIAHSCETHPDGPR